jgi:hypothetical protein
VSMPVHVTGFSPPDETWSRMKAVWDACTEAGLAVPREVEEFFGGAAPDPAGVKVDLPARKWGNSEVAEEGCELDVADIPPHVKVIRFSVSW